MGSMSITHWLVVLAIVILLFGAGKFQRIASDAALGIKAFRSGVREDEAKPDVLPRL